MRARRLPALAAVLALGVAPLAACGDSAEEKVTEAILKNADESLKDVDIDGDTVRIETEDGKVEMGEGAKIPEEFPSEVPMPEADHTIISSSVSSGRVAVMATVPDLDVSAEAARLLSELEGAGWTVGDKTEMNSGETQMYVLTASKDAAELSVTLMRETGEDGTVMYGLNPQV